ncbi:MAG: hypothetical protein GWN71_20760, partial [Gammaproteobacteria bacterium]|nr:hypothetical protein [Gemmatimonadota bacterium]NIU75906.1 hypothetical protein [Gammaproteobacteria bacterium]
MAELAARYRRLVKLWRDGDADQIGPALDAMGRLLAGLRVDAMGVRLVPVAEVFDRFPRLVRDAARSVGREVEFQLEGRSIEMDRAILNEVAEPVL